jgi:hypothetical protein
MDALETIKDLLPNTHLLNFHSDVTPVVPSWLGTSLKLMMGAGDLDQGGVTNIQYFHLYDVYFCLPWQGDALRKNVEYLLANYHHRKVICYIDVKNCEQVRRFADLFTGRFHLIDGFGGHTPHFRLPVISQLLSVGGEAVNIYERPDTVIYMSEYLKWFDDGCPPYMSGFMCGLDILTAKIYDKSMRSGTCVPMEADMRQLMGMMCEKIHELNSVSERQVRLSDEVLYELQPEPINIATIQTALRCLMMESVMPLDLDGIVKPYMRLWGDTAHAQLVVTKKPLNLGNSEIQTYVAKFGIDETVTKMRRCIDAIHADMDCDKDVYLSKAKYRTLHKWLSAMRTKNLVNSENL